MNHTVFELLEVAAFHAAIAADPLNDLPRLVFADWLDENGEPERAEFIRIQCELSILNAAGHGMGATVDHPPMMKRGPGAASLPRCQKCDDAIALEFRERELTGPHLQGTWGENFYRWFVEPPELHDLQQRHLGSVVVRRGFVAEVRCDLVWWVGVGCPVCGHRGRHDIGSDPVTEDECRTCSGTGITPAHGREVVRSQPVERVTALGLTPDIESVPTGVVGVWVIEDGTGRDGRIPRAVWNRLADAVLLGPNRKAYWSDVSADNALSDALLLLARPATVPA